MNISLLLEMAADAFGDRIAVGGRADGISYAGLLDRARRGAALIGRHDVQRVGLVDVSSAAQPILLFASSLAGRSRRSTTGWPMTACAPWRPGPRPPCS